MSKSFTLALLILFTAHFSTPVFAQCSPAAPAEGTCSGGNGAAYDGVNINSGQTYWYSGTGTFNNGSNINNGGTLRVCGNLTLNQINLNGGTIIITAGGTLTINGNGTLNLNNNVVIANYGTLNLNRDVQMQNMGNAIINATAASVLNMANYKLKVTGSNTSSGNILINKGTVFLNTLEITDNSDGVCLGNQSVIDTKFYVNSKTNAITVEPGAVAVLRFTQNGQNSAALSATSSLHVCKAPGATFNGTNVGAATVFENCTSASSVLPVTLTAFQAKTSGTAVLLNWETAQETGNDYFEIERSTDGAGFEIVSEKIQSTGDSRTAQRYQWVDKTPAPGLNYYRLKQTDLDGTVHFHGIRSAKTEQHNFSADIFPNPVSQQLSIRFSGEANSAAQVALFDLTGRQVYNAARNDDRSLMEIDLSGLPAGTYVLHISDDKAVQTLQVTKQ